MITLYSEPTAERIGRPPEPVHPGSSVSPSKRPTYI